MGASLLFLLDKCQQFEFFAELVILKGQFVWSKSEHGSENSLMVFHVKKREMLL